MKKSSYTRRRFLQAAGSLAAISMLPWGCRGAAADLPEGVVESLQALFPRLDLAQRAGKAIRESGAVEGDTRKIWDALFPASSWQEAQAEGLKKHFRRRIGEDFASSRTVWADRWRLTLTEAQLFALLDSVS